MHVKKRKKLPATVEKVLKPAAPSDPEKAQINIQGADELYREIRIENVLTDENGATARLQPGAKSMSSLRQTRMPQQRNSKNC